MSHVSLFNPQKKNKNKNNNVKLEITDSSLYISGILNLVDGIGQDISSFSKKFPVKNTLSNLTIFVNHAHAKIEDHYPEVDKIDFYR